MMMAKSNTFSYSAFQGKTNRVRLNEHVIKLEKLTPKFRPSTNISYSCVLEEVDVSKMLEVEISKMDLEIFNSNFKNYILKKNISNQIRESQLLVARIQDIENAHQLNMSKLKQIRMINRKIVDRCLD